MPVADSVREKALALAQADSMQEEAVRELLEFSEGKRVPVVLAHQELLRNLEEHPSDVMQRAAELLDRVLERLPME